MFDNDPNIPTRPTPDQFDKFTNRDEWQPLLDKITPQATQPLTLDEILDIDLMTTTRVQNNPLGFDGWEISARTRLEEKAKEKLKQALITHFLEIVEGLKVKVVRNPRMTTDHFDGYVMACEDMNRHIDELLLQLATPNNNIKKGKV